MSDDVDRRLQRRDGGWAWFRHSAAALACIGLVLGGAGTLSQAPTALAAQPTAGVSVFHQVSATPWLDHGKPVVLYIGAQFCPFCATERWALVLALSRFGEWSALRSMSSTPGQARYPGLASYDFMHASYRSTLIELQTREVADHAGAPLQALTPRQTSVVNAYDPKGSIPFVLVAGRYGQVSSGYSPSLIVGLSFARIHALIYQQPGSVLSRAVTREANIISALICDDMGAQAQAGARPAAACRLPGVRALMHKG